MAVANAPVQPYVLAHEHLTNYTNNASVNQDGNTSETDYIQEDFNHAPMYLFVCVSVFNILEFIIGTFGNAMVILVVCKVRAMRNPTNYFLFSLSVADLFVLLICQPTAMMEFYAMDRWYIGGFMCKYGFTSDVPYNTYVNLTDGNLTVFILPRSRRELL